MFGEEKKWKKNREIVKLRQELIEARKNEINPTDKWYLSEINRLGISVENYADRMKEIAKLKLEVVMLTDKLYNQSKKTWGHLV